MKINRILTPWLVAGAFLVSTSALAVTPNSATSSPTTMPSSPQTTATQTEFTPQQVKNIQKIVHDYLINNPQVLVEASQALQKQAQEKQQQYAMQAIEKNKQQLFNDPVSPVAGNPNGNVTLIEFFDYQCGHCKAMNKIIQSIVAKNKNLRVVLKELPIFGSNSQLAAKVALAAAKQGKYYAFHDALLGADNPLTQQKVFQVAKKVGLNVTQLKKDMKNPTIAQQLRANFKLAQALHLIGTPTFVIGNKSLTAFKFIPGATSKQNLQQLISEVTQAGNGDSATDTNTTTNTN